MTGLLGDAIDAQGAFRDTSPCHDSDTRDDLTAQRDALLGALVEATVNGVCGASGINADCLDDATLARLQDETTAAWYRRCASPDGEDRDVKRWRDIGRRQER